jgi:S1-C subfamily serine protease
MRNSFRILPVLLCLVGCYSPKGMEKGFLRPESVPEVIQNKTADIVQIELHKSFEIPSDELFNRKIDCLNSTSPSCEKIKKCQNGKTCFYNMTVAGTGFIDQSLGVLITARHVITNSYAPELNLALVAGHLNHDYFLILNKQNEVIFDTRDPSDRIFYIRETCPTHKSHPFWGIFSRCDAISLKLSRILNGIRPLAHAPVPSKGEPVYPIGYPKETNWTVDSGLVNSTGKSIYISVGPLADEENLLWENREYFFSQFEQQSGLQSNGKSFFAQVLRSNSFRETHIQGTLAVEGALAQGMSGGPILNSKGEWIGIQTSIMGMNENTNKKMPYPYSMGIEANYIVNSLKSQMDY